jgi:hypothetical protein
MGTKRFEGWVAVYKSGTDYEADLVRDRLDDAGVPAVVLTQRDHAFNLNVGDLAPVHVMVPEDRIEEARAILSSEPLSSEELERIALAADPHAPPAPEAGDGPVPDSGSEKIRLRKPDSDAS